MPRVRLSFLLLGLSLALPASLGARRASADDPPPTPPAEPPKEKKPDHDDTSIYKDWKIAKFRGIRHAQDRATFWEQKGVSGKDLNWLAWLWDRGEAYDKAAAAWEQFLGWTPDEKAKGDFEKNSKDSLRKLVTCYLWGKKYADCAKTADRYVAAYPDTESVKNVWDEKGRAQRLAGEDDKAIESFAKAAELKLGKGLLDMVDVYLVAGKLDEARAAFNKFPLEGGAEQGAATAKAFLALVGTDAPSLEKAVNVGTSEVAPKEWKGKASAVYYWHMQLSDGMRRMQNFDAALRDVEKGHGIALSTYNKLNPVAQKVEADMTEEAENEWYRKLVADFARNIPFTLVVPKSVIGGLGLKGEGQMVVVDAEGKIRWMRTMDADKYDLMTVAIALKKFSGG